MPTKPRFYNNQRPINPRRYNTINPALGAGVNVTRVVANDPTTFTIEFDQVILANEVVPPVEWLINGLPIITINAVSANTMTVEIAANADVGDPYDFSEVPDAIMSQFGNRVAPTTGLVVAP